ncbi:PH domain-containing protein [Kribbella sp. NPDC059898]|uniref:PH domain-containing protein n=1 Tax=Kribbella sp. NPDC059898 TaxID=3346995 RepID=UPI003667F59A
MAGIGLFRIFDPKVRRHLISDEGEVVIDEVRHHWVVFVVPMLEIVLAGALLATMVLTKVGASVNLVLLVLVFVLLAHSFWTFLTEHRDRFVVTNMRVMRIRGVFSQTVATTPIARVLDITLQKPIIGRMLGYGHFVFESAAQDQGFREIKWVSRPDDRDLTIQRVIQRTGLRASASVDVLQGDEDSDDDGTGPIGMDSAQEVTTTSTPAPAAAQTSSRPSPPPSGSATKSIFNSERGNWIDND